MTRQCCHPEADHAQLAFAKQVAGRRIYTSLSESSFRSATVARTHMMGMEMEPLSFAATLAQYEQQAEALLEGCRSGDSGAMHRAREHHPELRDPPASDARVAAIEPDDARLVVAREYGFD